MATEALNAGAVYAEMVLKMDKFDAAMVQLQAALKSIDRQVEHTKKGFNFDGLSRSIDGVGKKMSMAFTLPFSVMSFAAVGSAISDSVKNASDLNETVSKTQVIFGTASKDIMKWGDTADKNLGMSKRSALDAASSFALFGKQAGLSGQAVSDFSKQNVQMASDLASFFNSSPEEAITAISAALRGESEPIRRYNVLLDDASLRQEALKKGLISTTKDALTPQQRILAAQSLIMQQASAASGDFARTSDQLANQQRIQAAAYENATAKLGTALLPMMLSFKSTMVEVLTWINNLSEGQKKAIIYVGAFAVAIGPVLVIVAKLIAGISGAIAIYSGLKAAITGATLATNAGNAAKVAYTVATKAATAAQLLFNAACAVNPLVLIGAAAVAAAASIAVVTNRLIESGNEARNLKKKIDDIKNTKLDFGTSEAADRQFSDIMKNVTKMKDSGKSMESIMAQLTMWHDKALAKYNSAADKASQGAQYQLNWVNATKRAMREIAGNTLNTDDQSDKDKRTSDIQKWKDEKIKFRDQMSEYMEKAGRSDIELEEVRYKDECLKYQNALDQKFISTEEYWAAIDKLDEDHMSNKVKLEQAAEQKRQSAWNTSLNTQSTDIASKLSEISNLNSNFVSAGQKAAMSFAAAFTSAFAAISSLFSSMIQAQEQEVENKYSALTADEQAYVAYQDAEDAKAYKKMSAKEKKEHDLKAASDKAEKKREAQKQKELQKLQKEQARLNLINSLAQIGVSTAMGIMNIWADPKISTYSKPIWTAVVASLGAVQIAAAIAAAAPAMATGGLVRSKSGGVQITAAEAGYDEYVVPDTNVVMNGIASRLQKSLGSAQNQAVAASGAGAYGAAVVDTLSLIPVSIKVAEDKVCDILFGWSRNGKLLTAQSAVVAI